MYFSLVGLPEDLIDLKDFSFRETQINSNKLWEIKGTPYYIHTYSNYSESINSNFRRKDGIDFKYKKLSSQELVNITEYFLKKGQVTLVRFIGEDEFVSGYSLSGELRRKIYSNSMSKEDIQNSLEELNYLIKEECLEIDYLQLGCFINNKVVEFKLFSSSVITSLIDNVEENEQFFLSIYKEILTLLGHEYFEFKEVTLDKHSTTKHPLYNQYDFLNELFCRYGKHVGKEMGLSKQELDMIQKDLLIYSQHNKKENIYTHIADKIQKELRK